MTTLTQDLMFTYEDYLLFPDDGRRHELVGGEHVMTPSPGTRHQAIVGNLYRVLANHLRVVARGRVFVAPLDVVLSPLDVVQPDLVYVAADRVSIIGERGLTAAPDLAIEVLSESSRRHDELVKRKLYGRYDVHEYWVVDPVLESVRVYRGGEQGFIRAAELERTSGDQIECDLLPGLVIPLDEVFE